MRVAVLPPLGAKHTFIPNIASDYNQEFLPVKSNTVDLANVWVLAIVGVLDNKLFERGPPWLDYKVLNNMRRW